MIVLDKVRFHQFENDATTLQNLSITVFGGSCLIVQGANGIGKTTLLKAIASLSMCYDGDIAVCGISPKEDLFTYRSHVCYIGHKDTMDQNLSVMKNIEFWASMHGMEMGLEAAIYCFELTDILDIPLYKLSQGWKRRVSLARLLVSNARLWLIDEPFINLDRKSKNRFLEVIEAKCSTGGIVIITSHDENINLQKSVALNLGDFR